MKLLTAKEEALVSGGAKMTADDFAQMSDLDFWFFVEDTCRDYRRMGGLDGFSGVSFVEGAKFWHERIGYLREVDCGVYNAVIKQIGWRIPCFADFPV